MRLLLPLFLLLLIIVACQNELESEADLSGLPLVIPQSIAEFDSQGDHYFSHLGYQSIPLEDGRVLLPDRELKMIFNINPSGEIVSVAARDGRGPGEFQDIVSMIRTPSGTILVNDQMNKKIVVLDSNGEFLDEFLYLVWDLPNLSEVYQTDPDHYLFVYRSFEYLRNTDKDPEIQLVVYNIETGVFIKSVTLPGRMYARRILDGQVRGARIVPYAPEHFRAFNPHTNGIYLYGSDGTTISQIDASLDTVSTVLFDLKPERLSNAEKRVIEENTSDELWKTTEPLLPEYKAIADKMIIDHAGNFWLKLNHAGEGERWLIVSEEGELVTIVQLPEESILMHVSEYHLGVRLDDHLFALYEPVLL